ncbi:alpha/beta hydrolase [Arthrobacter sp. zg-Y20]|uniref:alpha/beta hydrolase n=1 Tax=unclassified Arthrobacter TaxID=235627 RepID=UPI001D150992|nr:MULTISPECIES: alpha/beta hydrolase [unclassified Arthrobacter]MCC3276288.1 alpha/beta hydrolase [Arthrobacter sp. zg-Y20]MDK1316447.1 alpha/beta hydrolase [Arthrobacter sp. zg.Y20]WIB06492.1 alpha/beta hydrolase [Arthrobacter sp. zg-Y20]
MKPFLARVDPELLPGLEYSLMHPPPTTLPGLAAFRANAAAPAGTALPEGVTVRDCTVDGLALRVFTPPGAGPHPVIYWLHGGGLIAGTVDLDTPYCAALCARTAAVVVAVDYRLAPEHPYPAPLDDAAAGLAWLFASAAELSVDPSRVAVAGSSAGGGLAAALTLQNRDAGGPALAFAYLMYPMLDATHTSPSAREFAALPTWNRAHSEFAWKCYLGAAAELSPYAVPALAKDLSGLPPTLIQTGELDLFRDEDITYASRLLQAGVPTELHVYPGAYHGFELNCPESAVGRQSLRDRDRSLIRALHGRPADPVTSPVSSISTPAEGSLL